MERLVGTYVPDPIETNYATVVNLWRAALEEHTGENGVAHRKVLKLVPRGVYRHYRGDQHYVLGIERVLAPGIFDRYVVLTIPYGSSSARQPAQRALVASGAKSGWFLPASRGSVHLERFTLVEKLSLKQYRKRFS